MKTKSLLPFTAGAGLGLIIALCLGAGEKPKETAKETLKSDWSQLQVVPYPNGTGFFDPDTGTIYIYDAQLRNCFLTRRLVKLGQPLL